MRSSAGRPAAPADCSISSAAWASPTVNAPTPSVMCRVTNSAGPSTARVRASRATSAVAVSAISQVLGARMIGQVAGSMQCVGQSQSAQDTYRVPSGARVS